MEKITTQQLKEHNYECFPGCYVQFYDKVTKSMVDGIFTEDCIYNLNTGEIFFPWEIAVYAKEDKVLYPLYVYDDWLPLKPIREVNRMPVIYMVPEEELFVE